MRRFAFIISAISARVIILLVIGLCAASGFAAATDDVSKLRAQLAAAEAAEDKAAVIELCRRIVALAPGDNKTWEELARTESDLKDYDRCGQTLDAWQKASKAAPAALEDIRGDIALEKEDYAGAEKHWLAFLARRPSASDTATTLDALADLCVKKSRWADSEKYRARSVAVQPTAQRRCVHAQSLLRLHQWDAAYAEMARAEKMDPRDAEVKEWQPQFERLERFLPKIKALDAALAKTPNDLASLLDQARLFTLADRPLLALDDAQRALKDHPESMRARIQAGEAFLRTGESEEAAKVGVSSNLVKDSDGHVAEDAIRELTSEDATIAAQPDSPEPLAARAKTLRALKQISLALADAQAALALDDDSATANSQAALCLDDLGRSAEALHYAVRATELNPKDAEAWYFRGTIESQRADFEAAITSFSNSLGLNESLFALRARESCERRSGKESEANADLTRIDQLERRR